MNKSFAEIAQMPTHLGIITVEDEVGSHGVAWSECNARAWNVLEKVKDLLGAEMHPVAILNAIGIMENKI